ncbi:hypothetical protein KR044_006368 [Drosophila immigrans]|nr:hypothetical protein KR044_006368 [Drosophila immigrans]
MSIKSEDVKADEAAHELKSAIRESPIALHVKESDSKVQMIPVCPKPRLDLKSVTVRQYLDQTVAPILLHGLQAVAKERPTDPITFLASYLLMNKNRGGDIDTEAQ